MLRDDTNRRRCSPTWLTVCSEDVWTLSSGAIPPQAQGMGEWRWSHFHASAERNASTSLINHQQISLCPSSKGPTESEGNWDHFRASQRATLGPPTLRPWACFFSLLTLTPTPQPSPSLQVGDFCSIFPQMPAYSSEEVWVHAMLPQLMVSL